SEDGKTFLYLARPGDHPGVVAEMFGIPARDLPAFLAANGISDSTKVAAGFKYRIPNAAARALAERAAALEADNARLRRAAGDEKAASERLAHAAEDARAEKALAESRATRLAGLERLWPWAKAALTLLLAAAAGAFYTAVAALRRRTEAEGYARSLANDLDIAHVLHDFVVEGGVVLEHLGHRHLLEDRVPRALGLAGAAVDALVGVDVELIRPLLAVGARVLVDAVDGADRDAAGVQAITAEARDDVGHAFTSSPKRRDVACS